MSKSARCDPGAARLSARRDICQRGVNGWELESHGSLRGKARGTGARILMLMIVLPRLRVLQDWASAGGNRRRLELGPGCS